jgi:hypothetical protein
LPHARSIRPSAVREMSDDGAQDAEGQGGRHG